MTPLLHHERIVINQKAKLIELVNEYKIRDEAGEHVGFIRQEGRSTLEKVARFVSSPDQFPPPRCQQARLLSVARP